MDIIRSSTRASKKGTAKPEVSDWYKGKIVPFSDLVEGKDIDVADDIEFLTDIRNTKGDTFTLTELGYIRSDLVSDPDVRRGLYPLAGAGDNMSTMSYRNWRHVYHMRRFDTTASPELQEAVELVRDNLTKWNPTLGLHLGKVWCVNDKLPDGGYYWERNRVKYVAMEE